MLKTIVFLMDPENSEEEELQEMVTRTVSYIKECGYDSYFESSISLMKSSFDQERRKTTLVICDSGVMTKSLLESGFYVVGMLHHLNEGEEFEGAKYVFSDVEQIDIDSFVKCYQRYAGEPWEMLRTSRLLIRETTLEDVDIFYELYKDPEVTRYMEGLFENPEDEKRYQRDYIEKVYGLMGFGVWTVVRLSDNAVIGRVGFSVRNGFDDVELGFLIGKEYQRQGYAFEACRAALDYGRDILGFDKVQTLVKKENAVSIHMCKKLGFEQVEEVDVEENIYGKEYKDGQKVSLNQATYGRYVRMSLVF